MPNHVWINVTSFAINVTIYDLQAQTLVGPTRNNPVAVLDLDNQL